MPGANGYQRRLKVDYKVWHDNITPNLAKTWHHFGTSDQNLTSLAQYPKYLRTKFKDIQPLLPKIKNKNKNKIRLKFSKIKNTSSLSHCRIFFC